MVRSMNTYNQPPSPLTAATYVDWASRVSAPLRAAVPRSNDSGQVTWSAVTNTPGSVVVRDYEVYAFSDSLQATKPIFVRVDYGMFSTSSWMQMTVGTATNGAGGISGIQYGVTPTTALAGGGSVAAINAQVYGTVANPRYCYASTDGSYIAYFFNVQQPGMAAGTADSTGGFIVERTRDLDGTPNGNGYMVWRWIAAADQNAAGTSTFAGTTVRAYDMSNPNSYQPSATFDFNAAVPPNFVSTSTYGSGAAQLFPVYGSTQIPQGASKALALAFSGDAPRLSQMTLTHYGAPTQWMSLGLGQPANLAYMGTASGATFSRQFATLFRWE